MLSSIDGTTGAKECRRHPNVKNPGVSRRGSWIVGIEASLKQFAPDSGRLTVTRAHA
jgi:hypothetical protein